MYEEILCTVVWAGDGRIPVKPHPLKPDITVRRARLNTGWFIGVFTDDDHCIQSSMFLVVYATVLIKHLWLLKQAWTKESKKVRSSQIQFIHSLSLLIRLPSGSHMYTARP